MDGSSSVAPSGNIVSYAWTQISGPSTATLGTPNAAQASASNLVAGTYIFQLTIKDNNNATATDLLTVAGKYGSQYSTRCQRRFQHNRHAADEYSNTEWFSIKRCGRNHFIIQLGSGFGSLYSHINKRRYSRFNRFQPDSRQL